MNATASTLSLTAAGAPELRPRTADGWGPGVALALGVHLMLVAALAVGVQWKINNPVPIEAEVWAEIPKAAAPDVTPPPPEPAPEPAQKVAEAPVEPESPVPEPIPDLVVAKKVPVPKKEIKKPKPREPVEVFETAPPKLSKKVAPKKVEPPKPATKPPVTPPAKTVPSKVSSPDAIGRAVTEAEAQRRLKLQRMMSDLGSLGTSGSSGGPSANYAGRIKARIKPNILFTDNIGGNPQALVEVRCGPDGRILSSRLLESSGVAAFDTAVLRAIERTEVLPADENGRVLPVMQIVFRPNDF